MNMRPLKLTVASLLLLSMGLPVSSLGPPAALYPRLQAALALQSAPATTGETRFRHLNFAEPTRPFAIPGVDSSGNPTFVGDTGASQEMHIAVDSREVVHAILLVQDQDPVTTRRRTTLSYANNDPASRQVTGFSKPVVLRQDVEPAAQFELGQLDWIQQPSILVDSSDTLHLLWIELVGVRSGIFSEGVIPAYRVFHGTIQGGIWSGATSVLPDVAPDYGQSPIPAPFLATTYRGAGYGPYKAKLGANGSLYLAVYESISWSYTIPPNPSNNNQPTPTNQSNTHWIFGSVGGGFQRIQEQVGKLQYFFLDPPQDTEFLGYGYTFDGAQIYDFAVDPSGNPTIVWSNSTGTYSSGLTGKTPYTDPVANQFSMLCDSTGGLHLAWNVATSTNVFQAQYRDGLSGPIQSVSTALMPVGYLTPIQIDALDQIHFFTGVQGLSTYSRLKDPITGQISPTFVLSENLTLSGSMDEATLANQGLLFFNAGTLPPPPNLFAFTWPQIVLARSGRVHAVFQGLNNALLYAHSEEPGLGLTNPGALAGMFPGGQVNMTTGNVFAQIPLFSTRGIGPTQSLGLYYNSLRDDSGWLGPSWSLSAEFTLTDHQLSYYNQYPPMQYVFNRDGTDLLTLTFPDGRSYEFAYSPNTRSITGGGGGLLGNILRLGSAAVVTGYQLTTTHGDVYLFNAQGRLARIQDPRGNYMTYSYDGTGRNLTQIQDMNGQRTTSVGYSGSQISTITDPAGGTYNLAYSGSMLSSVTFASGPGKPQYSFQYARPSLLPLGGSQNLMSFYQSPRAQAGSYGWSLGYAPNGRFAQVQDPAELYLLEGSADNAPPTLQSATASVRYADMNPSFGFVTSLLTDRRGFLTQFSGNPILMTTVISDNGVLTQPQDPNNPGQGVNGLSSVGLTYDTNGNLNSYADRWGSVTTYAYTADNLVAVLRPDTADRFQTRVANYTYTNDGFSQVQTAITTVTPTLGAAPVGRLTTYSYDSLGELIQINHPDVTLPDGTMQQGVTTQYQYNGPRHQLTQVTDEEGNTTNFLAFDSLTGLPTSVLRQGGTQPTTLTYDVMGNEIQRIAPQGGPNNQLPGPEITNLDGLYRIQSSVDASGMMTIFTYDVDSHTLQVQPPAGGPTSTVYDKRGFVIGGSSPDGSWSRVVDGLGNACQTSDLRGFVTNYSFDYLNRVTGSRVPGASTLPGGSGGGGVTQSTLIEYDLLDLAGRFGRKTEFGPGKRVTRTNYDNRSRAISTLSPDGLTLDQSFYDELDRVVARQRVFKGAIQTCTVTFRDERDRTFHVRTQNTDFNAPSLDQHSDTFTIYNKVGSVITQVDPLGDVTAGGFAHKMTTLRDVRQRVSTVVDGKGVIIAQYSYGDDDLVTEVKVPDPASKSESLVTGSTRAYTARKEVLFERDIAGNGDSFTYASLPGQVSTVTDAAGFIKKTQYDPQTQRVTAEIEAQGTPSENQTRYGWTNGFLTQTQVWNPETGAYDATFTRAYDQAGRLERMDSPTVGQGTSVSPERYAYNSFGELALQIAGTKTVQHSYDLLGQRTQSTWQGAFSAQVTQSWNGAGLVATVTDGVLSKTMFYDSWKGTLNTESVAVAGQPWKVQTHAFDNAGNYTGFGDAEGGQHGWPVDENNRPTQIRYGAQASRTISYTPGGLIDREILCDATGAPIAATFHTYNSVGERAGARTVNVSTGEVLVNYAWDYDARHLISGIHLQHLGVDVTLGLDARGRPATESTPGNNGGQNAPPFTNQFGGAPTGNRSEDSPVASTSPRAILPVVARSASYTFSASGNRTSAVINGVTVSYTHNAANQLIQETSSLSTVSHRYDEWGNEVQRTTTPVSTPSNPTPMPTVEQYGYNYQNHLSSYANSSTGANWQYDFYPTGERYGKTDLNLGNSELYVPRFGDVATEYSKLSTSAPILKNSYVQGTGIDSKQFRIGGDGTRRHMIGDQVGTIGMSLDDTGAAIDTSVKDAWGIQIAGGTSERYSGVAQRELDSESGLVFMRNRMYDPKLGRFTQTDPVQGNRSREHYLYASNNPVGNADPTGLQPEHDRDYWMKQVEKNAGIQWGVQTWKISSGESLFKYYKTYYSKLPDKLIWAGLAANVGKIAIAAFKDLDASVNTTLGRIVGTEASQLVEGDRKRVLTALLRINHDIAYDLAWQFEAYASKEGGNLKELEGIFTSQITKNKNQLENETDTCKRYFLTKMIEWDELSLDAWRNIHQGDVWLGTKLLAQREQFYAAQPGWDTLKSHGPQDAWSSEQIRRVFLAQSVSPIEGGTSFTKALGLTGDVTNPNDRWKWFTDYMLPEFKRKYEAEYGRK